MLEVADICKRFGDVEALAGCAFSVERGRMLGFLGPNGAGKTTTMRAIFGLVEPDSGEVLWDGEPVQLEHQLRFGYMPEERGPYPRMPVAEQVAYFGRLHGMEADRARRAALEWLGRLGLAERGTAKLEELSHGNQQRAQLAAAPLRTRLCRVRRSGRDASLHVPVRPRRPGTSTSSSESASTEDPHPATSS